MKATYEQMDELGPKEHFINFHQGFPATFWVFLVKWIMLRWGIEPVFGSWS